MTFTDLYIDGAWRNGAMGERFNVINPATEDIIASVASAEIADADAAMDAAQAAMKEWAAQTPRHRSEVLRKAWELMTAKLDHFAHLITLENGKARADAVGEATYAAEFFRWFAEEAVRAEHYASGREYKSYESRQGADPDFWCEWSERYINWRQLEGLGLMSKGNWA